MNTIYRTIRAVNESGRTGFLVSFTVKYGCSWKKIGMDLFIDIDNNKIISEDGRVLGEWYYKYGNMVMR